MLRPSPNHGTQRLPNDDDDDVGRVFVAVSQPTWFPWLLGRDEMRPNSKPASDSAFDARIRVVCERSQS